MSDYLLTAVTTTASTGNVAYRVVEAWLDLLFEAHEFGFRGYGGVMQLRYRGTTFIEEGPLPEGDRIANVPDLDGERLASLAAKFGWVSITGTMGLRGVDGALDIKLAVVPTGLASAPAAAVAHLDARLYRALYPDDRLDREAADRLRELIVALGANPLVDGFHAQNAESFAEILTFDAAGLEASLRSPTPVGVARGGGHLVHGIVTGIRTSRMGIEDVRKVWGDGDLFETTSGFCVMSALVEGDEALVGDDEDLD